MLLIQDCNLRAWQLKGVKISFRFVVGHHSWEYAPHSLLARTFVQLSQILPMVLIQLGKINISIS